jgi:sugar porter (SP) family MFS transporter
MTNKIGRKASIAVCAVVGLIGTAMIAVGWAERENFPVLVIAEVVVGLVGGWLSVICPMYCGEMAARQLEETIGVLFQLAVTFGILCAASMGLILDPRTDTATADAHLQERLQYVLLVQWCISVVLIPAAALMPESTLWLQERRAKAQATTGVLHDDVAQRSESGSAPAAKPEVNVFKLAYLTPLMVGVALASAQQLTGINAIMIYGPNLVGAIGLEPLVGNFCIMLWNFLSCAISVPLVRRFAPRLLYIGSTTVATVACAITGMAVVPGVLPSGSGAQHVLSGLGIMAFITAFECGIGPCFYVLAQDTFPAEVRSAGCSYTVWVQFAFNVVINWGFPIAMTAFSGGASGDQDRGMSVCFFIFAGIGFLTAAFLFLRMPKSNSELRREELLLGADKGDLDGVQGDADGVE